MKWTQDRASKWYEKVGVIRGCNYLPRTAVNSTDMWQAKSFDPETIEQELGWAKAIGYNSVRIFMQFIVWQDNPESFKQRLDEFLSITAKHGISVIPVFFCDCQFSGKEPFLGKQHAPVPGVHNSQWTPSPAHKTLDELEATPDLKKYVKDIMSSFANDKRVLVWDMYNEPGMSGVGEKSLPLVENSFVWAREVNPSQPITVGAYQTNLAEPTPQRFMELSDIITFHSYENADDARVKIEICQKFNRPVICTEFMIRSSTSDFFGFLPLFAELNVGWYNWGLVAGKTQTYMPWESKEGSPMPERWHHDVFHPDGKPYDPKEIELIKNFKFI